MGEVIRRCKNGRFIGYYLRFYENGRRRQLASRQPTLAEARRMLVELEARIARGEHGLSERPRDSLTVAQLAEQFLCEYSRPRLKDLARYRATCRSVLGRALPTLGPLRLTAVTPAEILRLRDRLQGRFAPGTVRNVLAVLSTLFSWGQRRGLLRDNPCRGVERPSAAAALDFLTRDEVQRLLAAAAQAQSPIGRMRQIAVALAVYTGLRKGEIFGLRWADLDLDSRRLTVARSYRSTPKSGKPRPLRLPSELVPLLAAWRSACPPSPEGLVLPAGQGPSRLAGPGVSLGLPRLLRQAGLRPLPHPFHALRHTFASHFVMAGGNILSLQKILGHSDIKITLLYAHLAPDYLADEMDRLRFHPAPSKVTD